MKYLFVEESWEDLYKVRQNEILIAKCRFHYDD